MPLHRVFLAVALASSACAARRAPDAPPAPAPDAPPVPAYDAASPPPPRRANGTPFRTAPLTVRFEGDIVPPAVEVACDGDWRVRRSISDGFVTIPGVPIGDGCRLFPKGIVSTWAPVDGGQTRTCTIIGTTTSCK